MEMPMKLGRCLKSSREVSYVLWRLAEARTRMVVVLDVEYRFVDCLSH